VDPALTVSVPDYGSCPYLIEDDPLLTAEGGFLAQNFVLDLTEVLFLMDKSPLLPELPYLIKALSFFKS